MAHNVDNREAAWTATDWDHKELNEGDLLIAKAREMSRMHRERAFGINRDEETRGNGFGYPQLDERIIRDGINLDTIDL